MTSLFLVFASLLAGLTIWFYLAIPDRDSMEPPGWVAAASVVTYGWSAFFAILWLCGLVRLFTPLGLLGSAGLLFVGSVYAANRIAKRGEPVSLPGVAPSGSLLAAHVVAMVPLVLWLLYLVVRNDYLCISNNDANGYHLPKAVMIMQHHGYGVFEGADNRMGYPGNFEMALASVLTTSDSDKATFLVLAGSYLSLVVFAGALGESWFGRGLHSTLVAVSTAAVPVALLHSSAHKNDLLFAAFALGAGLWGGRFVARGDRRDLLQAVLTGCIAAGTKPTGLFLLATLAPFLLWGLRRSSAYGDTPYMRRLAPAVGGGALAFVLLGGTSYGFALARFGKLVPKTEDINDGYGVWSNLWKYPYLAFVRSLSFEEEHVWVPWRNKLWYWDRYNHYHSEYGAHVSIALVVVLVGAALRVHRGDPKRLERAVGWTLLAALFFLTMPLRFDPEGSFANFPRYTVYIAAPILASCAGVVAALVRERPIARTVGGLAVASTVLLFGLYARNNAVNDRYGPWEFLTAAIANPQLQNRPMMHSKRAAYVVDQMAAPTDKVAMHTGFDGFVYPAFGPHWTRPITFLHPAPDGAGASIPDDVQWVVVDVPWRIFFGHPKFKTYGEWLKYLGRGKPTPLDLKVYEQLKADSRFELVYDHRGLNQAVFKRRESDATARQQ